jgi:hypothetical protein
MRRSLSDRQKMQDMLRQSAQAVRTSIALLKRTEELLHRSKALSQPKIKLPDSDIDQTTR